MPDLASFSTLPVFQIVAAALTLLGGVWMMVQGRKDQKHVAAPAPMPEGVQMFFQGPLVSALNCLQKIADYIHRLVEKRAIANESLRDIVHGQNNMMQLLGAITENQRKARDDLVRQTEVHTALMGKLEHLAEDILRELKNRRDRS